MLNVGKAVIHHLNHKIYMIYMDIFYLYNCDVLVKF